MVTRMVTKCLLDECSGTIQPLVTMVTMVTIDFACRLTLEFSPRFVDPFSNCIGTMVTMVTMVTSS